MQFTRYNIVGIANTFVGFSIIFILMFIGVSATLSNMMGYAVGSIVSYFLNTKYTFGKNSRSKRNAIMFFFVLGISYLINLITLQILLKFINAYLTQLISAIAYTVSSFILSKLFVFKSNS